MSKIGILVTGVLIGLVPLSSQAQSQYGFGNSQPQSQYGFGTRDNAIQDSKKRQKLYTSQGQGFKILKEKQYRKNLPYGQKSYEREPYVNPYYGRSVK